MKIAVAQIDTTVADFAGNQERILDRLAWAEGAGADLVVFPEMAICGYPPRDLLEEPAFVRRAEESVAAIAARTGKTAVAVGSVTVNEGADGRGLFNSALLLHKGRVLHVQHKTLLPEYDVFDEARHFEPSDRHEVISFGGMKLGLTLCEDLWSGYTFRGRRLYRCDPVERLSKAGAELVLNLSASPFTLGKQAIRRGLVTTAAKRFALPLVYCNAVGGNDDLVFDGRSIVADAQGRICAKGRAFAEDAFVVDTTALEPIGALPAMSDAEEMRHALVMGLSDYMRKCGFSRVVLGLSGGIDSAVVAALAAEAIGGRNVMGVLMPSPYSSSESVADAQALAEKLGVITCTTPIGEIYRAYRETLGFHDGEAVSLAEENIQARIRGNILMAISNREGAMVLATGNKSELSVGYCTLYGDMAGGFALISDLLKTEVYALARQRNEAGEVIPERIITKAPSAELKPDQVDQDTLPPYDLLDPIIRAYVEEKRSVEEITAMGFEGAMVARVTRMIDRNEYKRRQAPPGIKITAKAYGTGRRFPIAHCFS